MNTPFHRFSPILLAFILNSASLVPGHSAIDPVDEVNNRIGGVGILLEPTRPTVQLPNGMLRFYPIRKDFLDDQITSFPLSTISHRLGELFWLKPISGFPTEKSWHDGVTNDHETTTPYYYSTRFDESLIQTEFTTASQSAIFRFGFPSAGNILIANRFSGSLQQAGTNAISGTECFNGMQAFIFGIFSTPVSVVATHDGNKGRLTVTPKQQGTIELRYGISFIDIDQARRNLDHQIPEFDFDKVKRDARSRWNKVLGRVLVEGGTQEQRRVFYTALARCYERMVSITEDGRYFSGYDHAVHNDMRPFYVDNWIWDTFRAMEPLHALLDPSMQADKLQSYVRMYEQSGLMPTFAVLYGHHACMNANHAAAWFADSWLKGIRNFDLPKAYEGLKRRSLEITKLPWENKPNCGLDNFYNEKGYFPALPPGAPESEPLVNAREKRQAVAVTLENSYDDWCIAQLAEQAGLPADRELFLKKSANYRNVFRTEKGMMWPKDADGRWIESFDPKTSGGQGGRDYFDENTAYIYQWDVSEDYQGLFKLMGGRKAAEEKLDQLFREELGRPKYEFFRQWPDSTCMVGQFSMGNEPCLSIPYLYNRLGSPWKTQKRVRMLLDAFFTDTLQGIPGDEDGGGMSAFVVFSMLGIYPVTPGIPVYDLTSPVFTKSRILLESGRVFTISAPRASYHDKYIHGVSLNGKALNHLWINHEDIMRGGILTMTLADTPQLNIGTDPKSFPPSTLNVDPKHYTSPTLKDIK